MKFKITYDVEMQDYMEQEYSITELEQMPIDKAEQIIKYWIQQEQNIPGDVVANGVTIQLIEDVEQQTALCPQCNQIFYKTHGNQKYCCIYCADQAEKRLNAKRVKKYLSKEENRKKHLLRMATDRLIKKDLIPKTNCVKCGSEDKLEFHHFYYQNDFKTVGVYLCKKCHCELHNNIRKGR